MWSRPRAMAALVAASAKRGKRGRPQHRSLDVGDDQAVLLALVAGLVPLRIGLERVPLLLAFGKRLPGEQIMQVVVAVADQHGPETGRADAVLLPDVERLGFEALEQSRELPRNALIDAKLVDHGDPPTAMALIVRCRVRADKA